MSSEEDNIELRDLVAQTLEANGVLAQIKAQLRASVFLALDEDVKVVERANTALPGSPQTQSIAKITIESINLKVPHLTPNDDIKLQLLTRIKADESMMIPFRRWELHELPALTQGSTIEIWSVKTCSALDSPRYVIVFFQTKKADNLHEDVTLFDNANIKSIRLALNSDYYPQERMLLDFSRDQYADAHFNYTEFNKSYHNCQEKRSLVNFAEFKSRPMFVIDCSRRHLGLKSSTVDIKNMSSEEDNIELRDLVAQTLEANGVLAQIKAQLRASVFLALDEDVKISKQKPLLNNKINTYLNTEEGKAMFCIVHEFLEFCGLKFTLSVYEPESYLETKIDYEERQQIVDKLGLQSDGTGPLLLHLLQSTKAKSRSIEINLNIGAKFDQDKSESEDKSDSLVKTIPVSDCSDIIENNKSLEVKTLRDEQKFNATFDLSSPTVDVLKTKHTENHEKVNRFDETNGYQNNINKSSDIKTGNEDDTNGDSSSLVDDTDSQFNDTNNADKVPEITVSGSDEINSKEKVSERSKISPPKADKLKAKSSLSSLTDLPPLQLNKSRVNDILPSLYSKEFKEKSNLRELDKLFEMEAEYEEDFICDGDDLSLKSERSKVNLLDELQNAAKNRSTDESIKNDKQKSPNRQISDSNTVFKHFEGSLKKTDKGHSETNSE
ncbi:unnamed protein product [Phaedon cochleariae]|uniref:Uncharacterized protein n=1 Tax=Phaedon cochleariae TaxID=80249 RepID=A0A9N9SLU4_PHACE|nr:unnamed protein product [Phaedon cochleariae]